MKFVKYLAVLTILLCAIPTLSHAAGTGTVQAVGGGSSATWLQLGQGAQAATGSGNTNTPCAWSFGTSASITAGDNRTSPATNEQGPIWITWSAGGTGGTCAAPVAPYNIYAEMQLDSVVGLKCFFEIDSSGTPGCLMNISIAAGTAGAGKILASGETAIPADVIASLNGKHFTFGPSDIRPEDGKFASYRLFQNCGSFVFRNPYDLGSRLVYGLGYGTSTPGVGLQILSAFSSKLFNVIDFNVAGNDPFTGNAEPAFTVLPIGAQPVVVGVAPATDTTGIAAANDINGFTLALFYEGVLARSTDLQGPTTTNGVTVLVREPLSGTYNTFEYSIPDSSQFHTSQDDNFCNGTAVFSQTMNLASGVGNVTGARRARVIGNGEMVAELQAATTDTLGYFFWSAGNANGLSNVKYLTVNGVDPILDSYGVSGGTSYTPGALPQASPGTGVPPLTAVTFKNVNAGDYPIWGVTRMVTASPIPTGVQTLMNSEATQNSSQHDFIASANLKVWQSHFPIAATGQTTYANGTTVSTANDLCNTAGAQVESGGAAGGTAVLKQDNADFCSDFSNTQGLINKVN